ncbi:ATP-binding protein [Chitinophaga sp. 30R24]|uniref:ATP-binding protein n=1 Tax=Chitinophaga sp. 30R24 TaxID=3248838 RepID=UPI003B918C2B
MRKSLLLFIAALGLVFLLLVILFVSGYKVHHQSAQKLLKATDTLMIEDPSIHLMDSALFTLNDAESNFRLYTVLYERKYLQLFSADLGNVLSMVDTISYSLNGSLNNRQFGDLIREKERMSARIGELKKSTDSMLAHSIKNEMIDKLLREIPAYQVKQIKKEKVVMDTISHTQEPNKGKKGLFKRLGNAFANKQDTVKAQMSVIVHTKGGRVINKEQYDAMQLRKVVMDINSYYRSVLKQQLTNRLKLNEEESTLAGTNITMMEELKLLLISLREHAASEGRLKKQAAHHIVKGSALKMKSIVLVGLVVLLICLGVIGAAAWAMRNNNRMLKAGKLAAEEQTRVRTDFMNNMSHEMRTPLNSVAGFAEQLSYTPLNQEQQRMVASIEAATELLIQVVNDVLDFSKLEHDYISLSPEPFLLYRAFTEVVNLMRVQADKKGLAFLVNFDGDQQAIVNGDLFRLKQILINLISNAIKYTDQGSVMVTAVLESDNDAAWLFSFTVADTGQGITEEAQQHLFERFFQAGESRSSMKGTGLGLAITKRLLALQGGNITVSSQPGKGASFSCHIPYEKVSEPLPPVTTSHQETTMVTGAHMEGRYVLIADDQEMNLLLLKLILTRWKCRFDMATDGESAWQLLIRNNYDLVLLDMHMPGMSGVEVVERIRKMKDPEKAGVVALALTANITADDEAAFRRAGFNGWLLKPFREKDIYQVIIQHLQPAV